ncbi:hypothetical protein [Myceligenerans xiligouense]|uniref:Uncharacterized protein n=1 Tax=Myceligenerans xiligouense TaxID=253184 RepID=A0A3N4Z557_9MICO|nr:hypothetical protein [Myceligenerans xiligouense]RPF20352.1 hypothetical protein EDD34_0940 [Myceligenerans xiligouense]
MHLKNSDLAAPGVRRDLRAWLVEVSAASNEEALDVMDGRPGALDRFLDFLDDTSVIDPPDTTVDVAIYRDELALLQRFSDAVEAGIEGNWDRIAVAAKALLNRMDENEMTERPEG